MVFNLTSNINKNNNIIIQGGNCGLPNQFNVASAKIIYNNDDLGLTIMGILDSEGMGLAIITFDVKDMKCSYKNAPIINL